jgi:hypothetical protein
MGLAASRGRNPHAVPALLERHSHVLQRFVGTVPIAVSDPFWCARCRALRHAAARLTARLRRAAGTSF